METAVAAVPAGALAPAAEPRANTKERPDAISAMVTARAVDHRVEDVSARTPSSATFANPNGSWTTESYAGVVRSKDGDDWVPVDPSLERHNDKFEPKATAVDASFSDGGEKRIGSIRTPEGKSLSIDFQGKLPAAAAQGARLTYPAAVPGADLVVTSLRDGFNYSLVLAAAPAAGTTPEYRFPLHFPGLTPTLREDGSILLKDNGKIVATMTAPVMWDAENTAADGKRHPVATSLVGEGDDRTLILKPDVAFLANPVTKYPVTVDPSVTVNVSGDTWVNSLGPTASQASSTEVQVGSNSLGLSKSRSFLTFDFPSLTSAVVTSASLRLSNFQTGSCAGSAIRMSRITGAWTVGGLTWSNQPATTTLGAATSTAAHGASGCAAEDFVTFDATAIATDWMAGADQLGVQLKADNEGANTGFRKYRSLEHGDVSKAPLFSLTYNRYPDKPSGAMASPGNANYVTTKTPTLSAVVTDPDGGQVRGVFKVYQGQTLLWTGTTGYVPSGGRVETTVPAGTLNEGVAYTVSISGDDGSLVSPAPRGIGFTVDTVAPSMTITTDSVADGSWTVSAPPTIQFTYAGSGDTSYFFGDIDGTRGLVWADMSGDHTGPWYPYSGWHVLKLTPVDKAGNHGAPVTFSFGTGNGAADFGSPAVNARSTSAFPLSLSGPPSAASATAQWRLQGETSWRPMTQVKNDGSTWSGSVTSNSSRSYTPQLLWTAKGEPLDTDTLEAPTVVELRGCFHYPNSADICTARRTVQLVPSAFGSNFPVADLGPASVALFTGEASIGGLDAADSKAGVARSFSSFDASTVSAGVFGPGWSVPALLTPVGDSTAAVVDNRAKDGSFVIIDPDSGSETFVPVTGSTTEWKPLEPVGNGTTLTLTPGASGAPDTLELARPLGSGTVKTTWTHSLSDSGGSAGWTLANTDAPGTAADIAITNTSLRPTWIRESEAAVAATCTATTQTVGCRGLKITYAGSGSTTRVASIARVVGAATQGGVLTKTLATYTYDGSGQLASVCSASPGGGAPALCTTYTYTTVGSRTLLATAAAPGLTPWRFSYDSTGRITAVKRARPEADGDATWSVDYSLTPSSSGLPDMGSSAAAQWGQTTIPTKVFAVYPPSTGSASVTKAELYYTTDNGTTTNTATYGPTSWLVETSWLDAKGNTVQQLDGTGWARAQAATASDRLAVAADSSTFTVFNTWGDAETIGTRVTDEYGPAHTATLKDGSTGIYRDHTAKVYDDTPGVDAELIVGRPGTDGLGLVVKETSSTVDPSRSGAERDAVVTKYGYSPIVSGDGNGWTVGEPTSMSTQVDADTWSTAITRFDTSGREIESREPGGAADASGTGSDAHSSFTSYYTAAGSGDCGGKPAWDGMVCKTGPAVQPSGTPIPVMWRSEYNSDLDPTAVIESSGASTRTTSTVYDTLGRPASSTIATSGAGVANETRTTTFGFHASTGLLTTTTLGGDTITTSFDAWGRTKGYTDAYGTQSATSYDAAGRVASFHDGEGTYVYSYDDRGLLTSVDVGGGIGSFNYGYTGGGLLETLIYPNGLKAVRTYDEAGNAIGLDYKDAGGTKLLGFSAVLDSRGQTVAQSSSASRQKFTFDRRDRLTETQDSRDSTCTTRVYGFDASSNRASLTRYAAGSTGGCQSNAGGAASTHGFDAAGRLTDTGYSYDDLGRTLSIPTGDTAPGGAGALSASYFANDMIKRLSQNVSDGAGGVIASQADYGLDPAGRINSVSRKLANAEVSRLRYRFGGAEDSPTSIEASTDQGATWSSTRYVALPDLGMVGSTSGGTASWQLANLHGDIVATQMGVNGIDQYAESDEFGDGSSVAVGRYAWLGAHQRSSDTVGGLILMGARVYNPRTAQFLSPDPVPSGGDTRFGYPTDPVNGYDLTGKIWTKLIKWRFKKYGYTFKMKTLIFSRFATSHLASGAIGGFALRFKKIISLVLTNAATVLLTAYASTFVWTVLKAADRNQCFVVHWGKATRSWAPDFKVPPVPGRTNTRCW